MVYTTLTRLDVFQALQRLNALPSIDSPPYYHALPAYQLVGDFLPGGSSEHSINMRPPFESLSRLNYLSEFVEIGDAARLLEIVAEIVAGDEYDYALFSNTVAKFRYFHPYELDEMMHGWGSHMLPHINSDDYGDCVTEMLSAIDVLMTTEQEADYTHHKQRLRLLQRRATCSLFAKGKQAFLDKYGDGSRLV